MIDLKIPSIEEIIYIASFSAIISFGIVEILKLAIRGLQKAKKISEEPWWFNSICRSVSILCGAVTGILLCPQATIICGLIGMSAGVLNTLIVALVRKNLKKKFE